MNEPQNFDEALTNFRGFLQQNGYPSEVLWVTERDVLVTRAWLIYVKVPLPAKNVAEARQVFEIGIREGGVWFNTICASRDATYCNAWTPSDRSQAERAMMRAKALKLSASVNKSEAVAVRSRARWLLLSLKFRRHQCFKSSLFNFD